MDDAGEMSSWYVFNAIGFLYILSCRSRALSLQFHYLIRLHVLPKGINPFTIAAETWKKNPSDNLRDNEVVDGYFVSHGQLQKGKKLVITVD